MSDPKHIERTIRRYFAASSAKEIEGLELAPTIEVNSSMLPEPLHGEDAVREHLRQIAPFILRTEVLEIIIDRNSVATRVLTVGINGVELEGASFFRIFEGQISRIRNLFDTRVLMAGGQD